MPVPSAEITSRMASWPSILSGRAFSTFRILPKSGRIAWYLRSRPCFAEPPARVALDDEDLGFLGVAARAVGQLARERPAFERALALHQVARLAGGFAGPAGDEALLDDAAAVVRVLFQVLGERLARRRSGPGRATSGLPRRVFVWPSNCGSGSFTETTATSPSRTSSPVRFGSLSLRIFALARVVVEDARERLCGSRSGGCRRRSC